MVHGISLALQKKWVLCGVLEWDQLAKVEEVESAGVKKTTDPYLVAEYFLRLLQEASPLIVYDHFEPTQSFLGGLPRILSFSVTVLPSLSHSSWQRSRVKKNRKINISMI